MKEPRWNTVTTSEYDWERAALEYLREGLPDHEPYRAWANFEFIAEDGSVNEVDLLLVSLSRIFLVEIKSHPGRIEGDAGTWIWTHNGRTRSFDNPLLLANRKAKKLKSLLQHQRAFAKGRGKMPYIEAVVFLSNTSLDCRLEGNARAGVLVADPVRRAGDAPVLEILSEQGHEPTSRPIDRSVAGAVAKAMDQCGIRKSSRHERVGDFSLESLIQETDLYQDWEATHTQFKKTRRRVRIYPTARGTPELSREEREKAARREFQILDGLKHEGILQVLDYVESERGPALLFEHPDDAAQLDQWLPVSGNSLTLGDRLELVRQIAETVQFAHDNRLYHRALSPKSVLICSNKRALPGVKLLDWQSARQHAGTATGTRMSIHETATPGYWGANQAEVFVAPEALVGGALDDARLDVFSLGCIAYYIFSGHPPANSIESMRDKLEAQDGLHITDDMDGAPDRLDELVFEATRPEATQRTADVRGFLSDLDMVEEEITRPADQPNPVDAQAKQVLDGGFTVIRRLGKGSTAVALLVRAHDGREGVLKVALEPSLNERVESEGKTLASLRHQNIVELYKTVEISGHSALFMARAGTETKSGTETLAQRIREEGGLSLDLLQRFGNELLTAVEWLEQHGKAHRDIKPDNIGIGNTPAKKLTLVLFDFSLSEVSFDNYRAGTPPYLDPFISQRKHKRWDLYAERYAAAVTLYEMATGIPPAWGDGQSDPIYTKSEITLDTEQFDPSIREDLADFFRTALARKIEGRFDTAEDMRRAWQRVFEHVDRPTRTSDHGDEQDLSSLVDSILPQVHEVMPIGELGLSARLSNALDRLGVHQVGDLLALDRIRLYRNKGIGQRAMADIRYITDRLREHFRTTGHEEVAGADKLDPQFWSIDRLVEKLVPSRWPEANAELLRGYLGLGVDASQHPEFADARDAAQRLGVSRPQLDKVIDDAREYWKREKAVKALCEDIAQIVERHAGVLTREELTMALVAHRGSTSKGEVRTARLRAVAAAAIEVEGNLESARYVLARGRRAILLVGTRYLDERWSDYTPGHRASYAENLGDLADKLAGQDPLPVPRRVVEELRAVAPPEGEPALPDDRLIRLAVAASSGAALSSRMEIYPRGMAAQRALRLGHGSLVGPKKLSSADIRKRIASRYPAAEPLPDHPKLDALLEAVDSHLHWDDERSAYTVPEQSVTLLSSTGTDQATGELAEGDETAEALERRIRRVAAEGRFLALRVPLRSLLRVQQRLADGYELAPYNLEQHLTRAMIAAAEQKRVQWKVVLRADSAARDSVDWKRLLQLVGQAIKSIEGEILEPERPLLLTHPGLLARYRQMALLNRLRAACETGGHPGALVVVPASQGGTLPDIDGHTLPIVHSSEWAQLGRGWLERYATSESLTPTEA